MLPLAFVNLITVVRAPSLSRPIPSPISDSDCDNDVDVDVDDLLKVINTWGAQSPKGSNALPPADFDHDTIVEIDDLMIVIDNWTFQKTKARHIVPSLWSCDQCKLLSGQDARSA